MRTIKFKAQKTDGSGWVEGYYLHDPETTLMRSVIYSGRKFIKVDPETVCQFTGLKDKDGNDVWEGDTLCGVSNNVFSKGITSNYEIIWGVDHWHIKGTQFTLQELFNFCNNNIKVTGNIHDQ